jgi:hypothetical protein
MASNWPAIVFLALRPETYHASLSHGALTGYHPKAYTISPPPLHEVIERRLRFAIRVATGSESLPVLKGNLVQLESLRTIIETFMRSLERNADLYECIVNVAGGNVRTALSMVRDFFGSGHVDTEKIVSLSRHDRKNGYTIPLHEFLRALIFGDSQHFHPERSPVANVYDIPYAESKEHFLIPHLLSLLQNESGRSGENGFVPTAVVYDRMHTAGYIETPIDRALSRCLLRKLAESSTRRISRPGTSTPPALRITLLGAYHIERLIRMFAYVDAMIVDTPIFDPQVRAEIRDVSSISERLDRAAIFKAYLDAEWLKHGKSSGSFDWSNVSEQLQNDISKVRLRVIR